MRNLEIWIKGLVAAAVAGAANGIITGFAAVGIDPVHFNLRAGFASTLAIAAASALMSAIIGAAAYLKQSPLPATGDPITDGGTAGLPSHPPPDWRADEHRVDSDHRGDRLDHSS